MTKERLFIFDTTLRDGAQTQGVDFSVEDKRQIALALDALGDRLRRRRLAGRKSNRHGVLRRTPAAQARALHRLRHDQTGRAQPVERSRFRRGDRGRRPMRYVWSARPGISKSMSRWEFRARKMWRASRESIAAVKAKGREPLFDAEHFFDGYKANPDYALECLIAAQQAGARWLVLCDTNGGTMPEDVYEIVSEVKTELPDAALGIHAHNDTEQAVAVSLAAVRAGARQVQGTLNGLGERCGNANLCTLLPTLMLKEPFASQFETGVSLEQLAQITRVSRLLDKILNRAPGRHAAYVGPSAFAHKGGLHSSAMQKDTRTYEHVPPESVGNTRSILVSDQAGRSNLLARLSDIGIAVDAQDPRLALLLEDVKQREFKGYSYDGAEASFEVLARRALGLMQDYFDVDKFRVIVEKRHNIIGELVTVSEATVLVKVHGEIFHSVAEGQGPVDALSNALRKDLGAYSRFLADLSLVDYKVRILNTGTNAITRVMVESEDGKGARWSTVGISDNIIEASFEALEDLIRYKLLRENAHA